jgi:hypothetical protein
MTTEAALRARQLLALAERRIQDRADSRAVLAGWAIERYGPDRIGVDAAGDPVFPDHLKADALHVLDACGLLTDQVDEGPPVHLPHLFSQSTKHAKLTAPAAGTYR